MNKDSIHLNIRKARERAGLSQEELAFKIGISRQAYYNIESGHTNLLNDKLERIAGECATTLDYILLGDEDLRAK